MKKEDYTINGVSLIEIRNRYEAIVIDLMKKVVNQFPNFDNCPVCVEDVYALALSRIPPVYSKEGFPAASKELNDESIEEIVKYAFFQVASNPKHQKA